MPDLALPVTLASLVAVIISSVVIPYINAYITSPDAPDWLTGGLTAVLAGLTALAAYLADIQGVPDWQHALGLFVAAVIGAAGFRKSIEPGIEPILKETKAGLSPALSVPGSPGQGRRHGKPTTPSEAASVEPLPSTSETTDLPWNFPSEGEK